MGVQKGSSNLVLTNNKTSDEKVKKNSLKDLIALQKSYNEEILKAKSYIDYLTHEISQLEVKYYQDKVEKKKEYFSLLVEFLVQNPKIKNAIKYRNELKFELTKCIAEDKVFKKLYDKLLSKKDKNELKKMQDRLGKEILENINIEIDWEWYDNFDITDHALTSEEKNKFIKINEYLSESTKNDFEKMMDDEEGFMKDLFDMFNDFAGNDDEDSEFEKQNSKQKKAKKVAKLDTTPDELELLFKNIYRKLILAIHPDREQDPTQQEYKVKLMKELVDIKHSQDLASLLTLAVDIDNNSNIKNFELDASILSSSKIMKVYKDKNKELKNELDTISSDLRYMLNYGKLNINNISDKILKSFLKSYEEQLQMEINQLIYNIESAKENAEEELFCFYHVF